MWLHARGTGAAISRRRDPGKFLRCRLDASLSGVGAPDFSEQRWCIPHAAHARTGASLGNKQAVGVRPTCTLRSRCLPGARRSGPAAGRGDGSRVTVPGAGRALGPRDSRRNRLGDAQTQGLRPGPGDHPPTSPRARAESSSVARGLGAREPPKAVPRAGPGGAGAPAELELRGSAARSP